MSSIKSLPVRLAWLFAAFLVAAVTAMGIAVPRALAADPVIIDKGHVDVFEPHATSPNSIDLFLKNPEGKLVEPDSVKLVLKGGKYGEGGSWSTEVQKIIGKPAYIIPQTQDDSILWAGWDVMQLSQYGFTGADIVLDKVEGPGTIKVFIGKPPLGLEYMPLVEAKKDTNDFSVVSGDVFHDAPLTHKHFYWAFPKKGVYSLTAHVKAYHRDGHSVTTESKTVKIYVDPDTPKPADPPSTKPAEVSCENGYVKGADGKCHKIKQEKKIKKEQDTVVTGNNSSNKAQTSSDRETLTSSNSSRGAVEKCIPTKIVTRVNAAEAQRQGLVPAAGKTGATRALVPLIKDDRTAPAKWVSPSSLTFGISRSTDLTEKQSQRDVQAKFGLPAKVYMIGQTQEAGIPWVGANTQNPTVEKQVDKAVTWRLDSVSGPGRVLVFETANFGAIGRIWFSKPGDTHVLGLNTHVHPNWIFTAPGTYKVRISQTAKLHTGETVTGAATLTFIAGGQGNANDGHFDFGADITTAAGNTAAGGADVRKNADGSYTVTRIEGRTPSGKPCQLDGSLAHTGVTSFTLPLLVLAAGFALAGLGGAALRSQLRA